MITSKTITGIHDHGARLCVGPGEHAASQAKMITHSPNSLLVRRYSGHNLLVIAR